MLTRSASKETRELGRGSAQIGLARAFKVETLDQIDRHRQLVDPARGMGAAADYDYFFDRSRNGPGSGFLALSRITEPRKTPTPNRSRGRHDP